MRKKNEPLELDDDEGGDREHRESRRSIRLDARLIYDGGVGSFAVKECQESRSVLA